MTTAATREFEGAAALEAVILDALRANPSLTRDALPMDEWMNPSDEPQRIPVVVWAPPVVSDASGARTEMPQQRVARLTVPPGASVRLPAMLRGVLHQIDCGEKGCTRNRCLSDHGGVVIGGLAPLMIRKGSRAVLNTDLLPERSPPRAPGIAPEELSARLREARAGQADPALERAAARRRKEAP